MSDPAVPGVVAALQAFARRFVGDGAESGDGPAVRRADAHPDAPPRRPLSLAELDLAPFPVTVANTSVEPPALAPGERIRTFRLAPPAAAAPGADAATIEALLRRMEAR